MSDAHRAIRVLDVEFEQLKAARDVPACHDVIRRMAALDPENPQPYYRVYDLVSLGSDPPTALRMMETLGSQGPALTFGAALLELRSGKKDRVERCFAGLAEARDAYRAIGHDPGEAAARLWIAMLKTQLRIDAAGAMAEADTAARLYEALADPVGLANARMQLASNLEREPGGREAAMEAFREAAAQFREAGLAWSESRAWQNAGRNALEADRFEDAIVLFDRAIKIRRALGDAEALAPSLRLKGLAHDGLGQDGEAVAAWVEAVALYEQLDDADWVATTQILLGRSYLRMGRRDDAESAFRHAIRLGVDGTRAQHLEARYELGNLRFHAGQYGLAAEAYEAVIAQAVEAEQAYWEGQARLELGVLAGSTGDQARALELVTAALDLLGDDGRARLRALHHLGRAYYKIGLLESARGYLEESLELAVQLEDAIAEARAWGALGVVRHAEGALDEALIAHRKSLAIREKLDDSVGIAWSRLNAAHTLWLLGDRGEAQRLLDQSIAGFRAVGRPEELAIVLNVHGEFLRDSGAGAEALEAYGEAIEIARRAEVRPQLWVAYAGRGRVHEQEGNPAKALVEYRRAIDVVESLRTAMLIDEFKTYFFATTVALYDRAVAVQAQLEGAGRAPRTFGLVESARARGLADQLLDSRLVLQAGLSAETARQERELTDAITSATVRLDLVEDRKSRKAARRDLRRAEERLQRLRLTIRRESPAYSDVAYPDPVDLRTLQTAVLRDGETLLRYFVGVDEALVWIVERDRASLHRLPPPAEIRARVEAFRDAATGTSRRRSARTDPLATVEALGQALLPVTLTPGRRLLVVPDGPLHHLPFEVLRVAGRYIIQDHSVAVVPSATTLQVMRAIERDDAAIGFAGIGSPQMRPDSALAPITDVLDELAALFPAERRRLLRAGDATRERVLALDLGLYRYVHFATHSMLDAEDPATYGLLLSPSVAGGPPGILHVADVAGMGLAADLVVLAACQSGSGEQLRGEGLVGMTRAFLFAGSRALLVSLWNVDDLATADFMKALYGRLVAGRPVIEALRDTKLEFLDSDRPLRRQIAIWAPFVLVGDPVAASPTAEISQTVNPGSPAATQLNEGGTTKP